MANRPNTSATGGYLLPTISTAARGGVQGGLAAPSEDDELDQQLRRVTAGVTGIDPRFVRQRWYLKPPPQPEIGTDWCAVGHTDTEGGANLLIEHCGANGGFDVVTEYETIVAMATFYGPNAWSNARNFRVGLVIPQNMDEMGLYGLVFDDVGAPRRVPDFVGEEQRKRVDVTFRLKRAVSQVFPVRNLESIPVEVVTPGFTNTRKVALP